MRQLPSTMTPEQLRAVIIKLQLPQDSYADLIGVRRTTLVRYLNGTQPIPLFVQRCTHYLLQTLRLQKQIDADSTYDAVLKTIRGLNT